MSNFVYANDVCGVTSGYSQNPLVTGTSFSKTDSVTNTSTYDNYYFKAPSAGTVTITLNGSNVAFYSSLTACPTSGTARTNQTLTLSASDLDFNVRVYRSAGSGTKNYTLTVAYSLPTLSIANASQNEGNSGTSNMNFTVTLSQSATATVTYATSNGTATTSGSDYAAVNDTLNFNNETSKTIPVPIMGDTMVESDETFTITLSNASGATISTATATGTIINDDSYSTSNTRDFTLVSGFPYNIKGDMQIIGNSVTLVADTNTCAPIHQNNNNYILGYADKDSNSSTFNSTSADITLPVGTTKIKYAGLYWQGRTTTATTLASGTSVKLRLSKDSAYQTVTTDTSKFNWITQSINISGYTKLYSYQAISNVTALLQADINKVSSSIINSTGYNATIWVADVVTDVGIPAALNSYGAWSLVVVYEDSSGTLKNISVYDGYNTVQNSTLSQTLTGFYTPPSGTVNSKFLVFGGEGDYGQPDSTTLTNKSGAAISLGSDVFQSTETNSSSSNITTRNPNCENTIGIDIHTYDVGTSSSTYPIIGNSQTSTTIAITSTSDGFFPGIFAFSTDIYTPSLCYIENIFRGNTNISGQSVRVNADENLTVRVYVTNTGNEAAQKVQILHQFDSSFPYVTNSTDYNNTNPTYQTAMPPSYVRKVATDASGDDIFEYNSTSLLAKINLGSGASFSSGGTFSDNNKTTAVFEYNATVKTTQDYKNTYQVAYVNSTSNIDYSNNPVQISSCDGSANSFFGYSFTTQGNIDAIDNYGAGYTAEMGLQTKIANKSAYTLDALWLGTGTTPTSYTGGNPLPIRISLSDNTCSTDENLSKTTGYVEATISNGFTSATSTAFQIIDKARKIAKLRFRYIDWSNLPGGNYSQCLTSSSSLSSLEGVPACLNSDAKILAAFGQTIATTCASTGARPACQSSSYSAGNLPSAPYNNALGCFICLADALNGAKCSTDNFAIRPNDFNSTITANQKFIADKNSSITFRANQYNGTGTKDYNETVNTSFRVDVNISDSTKTCAAPSIQFTPTIVFIDGTVTNNYSLPNVGDFNLTMYEKSGSEFALVDADDTPDSQRYISTYTQQIKVVPKSFNLDGNFTNGGNGFSYLSDFETHPSVSDRGVSALLDLNISARSDTNAILSNYTSLCYAKDANITMNTTTSGNTLTGLSKLLWYDNRHDLNGSVSLTSASNYKMKLDNTQFDSTETNGSAQVNYLINFNRNSTNAVQPFVFQVSDVNTSDEDNVTGTKAFTNQKATYYYGRAFAPDQTYIGKSGTATIYYEVYCNGCSATTRTTFGIDGNESVQAINWYQNTDHNSSAGIVNPKPQQFTKFSSYPVTNSTTASISTEALTLQGGTNLPFTDKVDLNSDNWLVYYPTYYTVNFKGSGDWAGAGSVNDTNNTGTTVDANVKTGVRIHKRLDW